MSTECQTSTMSGWSLSYEDYIPKQEKVRESLLSVGNGYFCVRGSQEESTAGESNYPATYMAALYNRLPSMVGDKEVFNEDFVNGVNSLEITFKIDDGEWLDINQAEIVSIKRNLCFKSGVLSRVLTVKTEGSKETKIESRRLVSMADKYLLAQEYCITPLNYSGRISVRSTVEGDHINDGVARYAQLNQEHLKPVSQEAEGAESVVVVSTTVSDIQVANVSVLELALNGELQSPKLETEVSSSRVNTIINLEVKEGDVVAVTRKSGCCSSNDVAKDSLISQAREVANSAGSFAEIVDASTEVWAEIWNKSDIELEGDDLSQMLLRLHIFHSVSTASANSVGLDISVGARGLHGEAYRGHIFWDELYILPFFDIHFKDVAKEMLTYRYNRLDAARKYAAESGYKGAMFPWQSGSDGREETQTMHLNPLSGKWGVDHSCLQRHVSIAVAYNVWQYYWITEDLEFLKGSGAELFLELCRFWASKCEWDSVSERYSIAKVMGPDEFHEMYPGAEEGGLKDNTYTNVMVAWLMERASDVLAALGEDSAGVKEKITLTDSELQEWAKISERLNLVISDEGILAQYDGYFDIKELDWDHYREKYKSIYRMDRLLKAEGKSADDYKVAKQADTLMLFYCLDKEEIDRIINKLGYKLPDNYFRNNYDYYLPRTSHGSTLSRLVHSVLAAQLEDPDLSWDLYQQALTSDYNDIQGGTTGEGVHLGVMTGTVFSALTAFSGLNLNGKIVRFKPALPEKWQSLAYKFSFKGNDFQCRVEKNELALKVTSSSESVDIQIGKTVHNLPAEEWKTFAC